VQEFPYGCGDDTCIRTLVKGTVDPSAVAVDGSGDVFYCDKIAGSVNEILAVNGSIPSSPTIRTIASGVGVPSGVAVDTSGNVFFVNYYHVEEIVAVNGSIPDSPTIKILVTASGSLLPPISVAVDGSGNLFLGTRGGSSGAYCCERIHLRQDPS
jgi:DNA-binding beta-propeller fold protein YncE